MFFYGKPEQSFHNHHGDSINPDFAKWVVDFISSFSDNFLIVFFTIGFIIIIILVILILFLSRKK
jgi:hypothetical protein|tara:strand:- start:9880 stop:10074 length:195 start_codon:yes stop_codon:yes gene_type:complete